MKKKIFLIALMVSIFACALAISVGAKNIHTGYLDLDGNEIVVPTYDEEGDSLVWIRSTLLNRAEQYGIKLANGSTYYEINYEGTTYYIFGSKTKNTISVDSNYAFEFKSGIGIDNNIIVMNLDGITHSDGTGVKYFGILIRNDVLQYLYIPSSIVSMKCKANGKSVLLGDSNLSQVEFESGSQMTEIESHSFKGCGIEEIILPESLTSIGEEAFLNCKSLKKIYIPKTVTFIAENAFNGITDEVYYFTGTEEEKSAWDSALDISVTYVNHCDVYYGEHKYENDYNCLTALICERCDMILEQAKDSHQIERIAVYENGYTDNGYKKEGCVSCGTFEESVLAPLFTCQGYSTQQAGGYGILVKFAVNNSTIKEYEDVTGTKISYGLFAVLETKLGEGDAFDKSGNAINGTISTDLTKYSFDLIEFKLTGIKEKDMETSIAMGAYISVNDGENIVTTCIQAEGGTSNGKYSFVSYDALLSANQ